MNSKFLFLPMSLATAAALHSCGSADFDGGSGGRLSSNVYHGQQADNLTWFWQCENAPVTAPTTNDTSIVIQGGGDHFFKSTSFDKTPLTLSGKVCPPMTYPRDIVFIIDVSGSMIQAKNGNDKVDESNSCNRLRAVEAIIKDLKARGADARFGIITFAGEVVAHSNKGIMFSDTANLFADVAQGKPISQILCAADGATSYAQPLLTAEEIFQGGGRADALKEIYFVSDGQPNNKDEVTIADRLHSPGVTIGSKTTTVTIATIMLGTADDTILKTKIASTPSLHVGSVEASNLAKTMSQLAANEIVAGAFKYRPIGTELFQEIPLLQHLKDYSFSLPSFTIDKSSAPNGLEVKFEYRDKHNNSYSKDGKILWTDAASK